MHEIKTFIIVIILFFSAIIGLFAMADKTYNDLWKAASLPGKIFTGMCIIITLPGIIVYMIFSFMLSSFYWLYDLLFPRKSGYRMKVSYDQELYESLKLNKIYCEHWGQMNPDTSVIVFLWEKDYKKALKLFPELQHRVINN